MPLHLTRNMDLARGSKVFPPWKMSQDIARKTTSHPVRLKGVSIVPVLTTALARPQVHALGIEFHQEDVIRARVGIAIQGAFRVACHPGIANVVHLRKDRQLSFAVRRWCGWKLKEIRETDRIIRRKTDKKSETKIERWHQIDNCMPHGIRTRPLIQFQLWEGRSAHLLCLFQSGHGFSIGLSLIRPNDIVQPSNDQWSTFWTFV